MKEFEDTSKWEDIPCLRTERINIVKAVYRLSAICITIPMAFFIEIEQKSQNLAWTARTVLRKKIKTGRILLPDLKQCYEATVIKTVLAYTHIDQWNRLEIPEMSLGMFGQLIYDKRAKTIQGGKG